MLNSTLVATERCICCIIENYQTEKGVNIPKVLQPFMQPYINGILGGQPFIPFIELPKTETAKN